MQPHLLYIYILNKESYLYISNYLIDFFKIIFVTIIITPHFHEFHGLRGNTNKIAQTAVTAFEANSLWMLIDIIWGNSTQDPLTPNEIEKRKLHNVKR